MAKSPEQKRKKKAKRQQKMAEFNKRQQELAAGSVMHDRLKVLRKIPEPSFNSSFLTYAPDSKHYADEMPDKKPMTDDLIEVGQDFIKALKEYQDSDEVRWNMLSADNDYNEDFIKNFVERHLADEAMIFDIRGIYTKKAIPSIVAMATIGVDEIDALPYNDKVDAVENDLREHNYFTPLRYLTNDIIAHAPEQFPEFHIKSYEELCQENIIDMTPVLEIYDNSLPEDFLANCTVEMPKTEEIVETGYYESEDAASFYSVLPPFKSGVVKVNEKRWLYFYVNKIDESEKSYDLAFIDYVIMNRTAIPGLCQHITVTNDEDIHTDAYTFAEIAMHMFANPDNAKWLDNTPEAFYLTLVYFRTLAVLEANYANRLVFTYQGGRQITGLHAFLIVIFEWFNHYMSIVNYKLITEKLSKARHLPIAPNPNAKHVADPEKTAERKIRHIGKINITSVTRPVAVRRNEIHYCIPVWQVRGHMRHYKNGHSVWIAPTVHKRKILSGEGEITPTTLKLHDA